MQTSSQWSQGRFHNPQPLWTDYPGSFLSAMRSSPDAVPAEPIQVATPALDADPATGLQATWLGHSTVYVNLEGTRILTDPMWSDRASPLARLGPRRFFPAPIALEALPRPDAVVLSHDHYDHLDRPTILRMRSWDTRFIVPLGVGRRLASWGIQPSRITELDWWERTEVKGIQIVCTPARHASGRTPFDKDRTLWSGFAFLGTSRRVYFSGDTGLFRALDEVGRLGPFDLTLIECGEYGQAWPDWHLGPEQAVEAHLRVGGQALLPIHWGTFKLAPHAWTEPMERVLAAASAQGVRVLTPRPGATFEPALPSRPEPWWPALPWKTAREVPILATSDGLKPVRNALIPQN
jgi:L-ascorbate metabolism protein UlaG (beta-lactamase superfamily)